jgi:hypothetical protein
MKKSYYYATPDNEVHGPISWEDLLEFHRVGAITGGMRVTSTELEDWQPFEKWKERIELRARQIAALPPLPKTTAKRRWFPFKLKRQRVE